jgi:pyruvate/2-oxoglutarate dehydrogenase complex dihydrolipoamide acyltransferase (E2) component
MPHPIHAPRINNNDDEMRLSRVWVRVGARVQPGERLAELETEKATVTIESDRRGYILRIAADADAMVTVGSILMFIGDTPDEPMVDPAPDTAGEIQIAATTQPTAKARQLLEQHQLHGEDIPARGERLTVEDVERYLASKPADRARAEPASAVRPLAAGTAVPLTMEERGMLRSVLWHRDEAVPAYLEVQFDQPPWEEHARAYASEHRLLSDPLIPLIAYRLVTIAGRHPKLRSTIVDGRRHVYDHVNLGFTIQVESNLYLVVVQRAETCDRPQFINALNQLHRKAIAHKLGPDDLTGPTLAFSSMARWQVERHVPILPPHVSMIVAHTVGSDNRAVLGATYDHRVLSGGDAVEILHQLCQPPDQPSVQAPL